MNTFQKITFAILLFLGLQHTGWAQIDLTMYNMTDIPQSNQVNPSMTQTNRFYIGIPLLSSIHLHHQNTVFNPFHLFSLENGLTTVRTTHFTDRVGKYNTVGMDVSTELLSFGFRQKKNYFSFSVKDRISGSVHFPKDLLRFPITGNGRFDQLDNNSLDFTDLAVDADHYAEIALGWQRQIKEKWSVGLRLKYLKGYQNIRTSNSNVLWTTDPITYDWTFTGEMNVMTSGIDQYLDSNSVVSQGNLFSSKKNNGVGVDLGATYSMNEKLDLSFSLIDFGFIKWKTDNRNYTSTNGEFVFTGLQLTADIYGADSTLTDSLEALGDELVADLENNFGYTENRDVYKTSLRSRLYLNANYKLYKASKTSGTLGLTAQGKFRNKRVHPSISLAYYQKVGQWMSASISYSAINKDYRNIGAGLRLNGGPIQWYITVDNLMPLRMTEINFPEQKETITYPSYSENMMFHTGVNLTFKPRNDRDGDGVVDKRDNCPDIPGTKEMKGCPDTDGDGIADQDDDCPNTAGPKELNGCPDTDGDTVIDKNDLCPEVAGPPENSGCPDADMDGVLDHEDDCPDVAGPIENKGCPWGDKDQDTVLDKDDKCPEEPGDVANEGCPWGDTDGDGVADNIDKCPEVAGVPQNNGCPLNDMDSDGVPDDIDKCPNTYGSRDNEGCPKVSTKDLEVLNSTFSNVEFKSNTAEITQESYPSIDKLVRILEENPERKLKISGHTDSIGEPPANLRLSKKRAQTVANLLIERGISRGRLEVIGYGESRPIASNMYHPGRQKNRRVELEFIFD